MNILTNENDIQLITKNKLQYHFNSLKRYLLLYMIIFNNKRTNFTRHDNIHCCRRMKAISVRENNVLFFTKV